MAIDIVNVIATLDVDSKNAIGYGGVLVNIDTTTEPGYYNIYLANDGSESKYIRFLIFYKILDIL